MIKNKQTAENIFMQSNELNLFKYSNIFFKAENEVKWFFILNVIISIMAILILFSYITNSAEKAKALLSNELIYTYSILYILFLIKTIVNLNILKKEFKRMRELSLSLSKNNFKIIKCDIGGLKMRIVDINNDAHGVDFLSNNWRSFNSYYQHLSCCYGDD